MAGAGGGGRGCPLAASARHCGSASPAAGETRPSSGAAGAEPGRLSGTTEPGFALRDSVFKQDRDFILRGDVTLPQSFFCIPFSVWVLFIYGC